jgi:phage tail protein X
MKRYEYNKILQDDNKNRYYSTTIYPEIPLSFSDVYLYTTQGDRFDLLAEQYYNDSSLWWIISSANSGLPQNSYYIPEGQQIRVPQNIGLIVSNFKTLNEK